MAPYQKGGMFQVLTGSDYTEAKKRLNIRNYRLFLSSPDFNNYDTKFFRALLPIINTKRREFTIEKKKVPVPKTLKDVITQPFFTIAEVKGKAKASKPKDKANELEKKAENT